MLGEIKAYGWATVDGKSTLCPIPIDIFQSSFSMTPYHSIEERKVGFFPANRIQDGVEMREVYVSELLVEDDQTTEISPQSEELILDLVGRTVTFKGKKFELTPQQIMFLKFLAQRKQDSLNNNTETEYISGVEVLKKINSTSKRTSDAFRNQEGALKALTESLPKKKGFYRLRGTKIRIIE